MLLNLKNEKKSVSLQRKILLPVCCMFFILLLVILLVSQFLMKTYIHNCIEGEMESISTAARDVIEREYIYNEQISGFQEDIYRLARQLVQRLNELPRRIITTDYDIRFVVHTDELTLRFVTLELSGDEDENVLSTEIMALTLEGLQENPLKGNHIYSHSLTLHDTPYFVMCMPLHLQRTSGIEDGFLISYVNTSSQSNIVANMNQLLTGTMLIALILAMLISLYLSRRVSHPLGQLCKYAETIGRLDFSQKNINSGILEVDELTSEMNRMAGRLAEYDENQKKFLLNISHDLRTPLTSIEGYAECIYYDVTDDPKKSADTIIKESHHLKQMVEDLLFMSRMDMAEDRFLFEILDVVQAVQEAVSRMKIQAQEKQCSLLLQLPENPVLIWGDDMHLARALMNILSNSLRYAQSQIRVSLQVDAERVFITIEDDGSGFSEEDLKYLFNRFYKGKKGNFGVGMSIVKMIVDQMSGEITVGNREEGGAKAILSFPLLPADTSVGGGG